MCYGVKPEPEDNGRYESQGYDYVSELDHDMLDVTIQLEGHKRAVRIPR